jgi:hypothetical protein
MKVPTAVAVMITVLWDATLWRSTLKLEVVGSSEVFISTYKRRPTWCHITKYSKPQKTPLALNRTVVILSVPNHFTDWAIPAHLKYCYILQNLHNPVFYEMVIAYPTGIRSCGSRPLKRAKRREGSQVSKQLWDNPNDVLTPNLWESRRRCPGISPSGGEEGSLRQLRKRYSIPKCRAFVYSLPKLLGEHAAGITVNQCIVTNL